MERFKPTISVPEHVKDGTYDVLIKGDNCNIGNIKIVVSTDSNGNKTSSYDVIIWSNHIVGMRLSEINRLIKSCILPLRYRYGISITEKLINGQKRNRRDGIYKEINFV